MQISPISIQIKKLRVRTIIGVLAEERENLQEVIITATISLRKNGAALSDKLDETVDYASLGAEITKFVENSSFLLIERLAGGILELIMQNNKVAHAEVTIEKPNTFALRFAETVSVTLAATNKS